MGDDMSGEVVLYRVGPLSMSVCAPKDMSRENIIAQCEGQNPCGTEHGWSISTDKTFKGGEPMPCKCDKVDDRLHYFIEC